MGVRLAVGACTHVGLVRPNNEDALCAVSPVFVVADGMGGHRAGEVASAVVVDCFTALAEGAEPIGTPAVLATLDRANDALVARMRRDVDVVGMGTTCVGLALVDDDDETAPRWFGFNVGDSRLYLSSAGLLTRVSVDHSEVQEMIEAGVITEEDARTHPRRNVVTRSLGCFASPQADTWHVPVQAGQRWLLCSDGLTGELRDDVLAHLLAEPGDAGQAAERLVEAALKSGGRDNVTVLVVDVLAVGEEDEPPA